MMNIQKFLGIRDPKTPYKKGTFVDQSKQYSPRVGRKVTQTTSLKALMSIRTKVLSIENILKRILGVDKKTADHKKRVLLVREQDKRSKRASATQPLIGGIIRPPRMGILDAIKNFVLFTFLGWLSQFILPHIDKLKPVVDFFGKALEIFDFVFKHILGGIGNMIKFGYDTWDMITGKVDDIKKAGSDLQNVFDDTVASISQIFDGTVEIANSFLKIFGASDPSLAQGITMPSASETPSASPQLSTFPVQQLQSGGRIDPTTPITRGIQTEEDKRRTILTPPTVQQQQTVPGRDVGGEKKVKELYGSQDRDGFFGFRLFAGTQERDAFSGLTRASFELKQPRSDDFLGLGNLMGASVDIALGQKPERRTYQQFAEGIKYLIDYRLTKPDEFEKIDLERMIEKMVETKVDSAINKIREEIAKRSTTTTPGGGLDMGGFTGGITPGDISEDEMDLFIRMVYAEAGGEGKVGMALVARSILNRLGLIQSGKVRPGTFLSSGKSLTEIFTAPRQYQPMRDGRINQPLTESQRNQAVEAIMMAQNPTQLVDLLRSENVSENDITRLMASTGFRNYEAGAGLDRSQQVNEVRFKRHTFNTAGNTMLLVPNEIVAVQQPETGDVSSLASAAQSLIGMSSAAGPGRGRLACVWAVNQVFRAAGIRPPWGDAEYVPTAEQQMIRAGYSRIDNGRQQPGDLYITHREAHIGIVLPNGNIISNSSSGARFSWEASLREYQNYYGGPGRFYRMPAKKRERVTSEKRIQPPNAQNIITSFKSGQDTFTERRGSDGRSTFTKNGQPVSEQIFRAAQVPQMRKGGLVFSNNQTSLNPPETYASYNKPSPLTKVFIQPVMIPEVSSASVPPSIKFPTPRVNSSSNASLTRN